MSEHRVSTIVALKQFEMTSHHSGSVNNSIQCLLSSLTLDEKISLLAARSTWETAEIRRLNIPALKVCRNSNIV